MGLLGINDLRLTIDDLGISRERFGEPSRAAGKAAKSEKKMHFFAPFSIFARNPKSQIPNRKS
jgi:hypothetical protein